MAILILFIDKANHVLLHMIRKEGKQEGRKDIIMDFICDIMYVNMSCV